LPVGLSAILMIGITVGQSPLLDAVQDGAADEVRIRMQVMREDVDARDAHGATALHSAAWLGETGVIRALLDAGADVRARTNSGETALILALRHGPDVIRMLLDAGADVDARDSRGLTALLHAVGNHEFRAQESEREESLAVIVALLEAGANPDAQDANGGTPLTNVAWTGAADDVVPALLSAGADANTWTRGRVSSALMLAARAGNVQSVRALVAHGAEVDASDGRGWTALMDAVLHDGDSDVVLALLDAGADPNAVVDIVGRRYIGGMTVLMLAADRSRNPRVIRVLLEAGADALARNRDGARALDLVAGNESLRASDAWQLLVDATAE
jgi:uncharacterized protein